MHTQRSNLATSAVAIFLVLGSMAFSSTIHVPADQPTIQAGINAAMNNDTVLVAAGTYVENIDFHGKAIKVRSSKGAKLTIIDGNHAGPVVTFSSGETVKAMLKGFTLRNGLATAANGAAGGGIFCRNSSPTIQNNTIIGNTAGIGGGIEVAGGSPSILKNRIANNLHDPNSSGGWGGGISLENGSSAIIIGNKISGQFWTGGLGGGVALNMAGSPILANNLIFSNATDSGPGGGVWIVDSSPSLIQNLIFRNNAFFGGGLYIFLSSTSFHATFVNNTFAENVGDNGEIIPGDGSAVYAVGFDEHVQFFNNIFASSAGRESFFCSPAGALPGLTANDGFSSSGAGFGGVCSGVGGTNGNISSDPQFVKAPSNNYQLKATSPAVDAGDDAAPQLPVKDLKNKPRIVDGNADGNAVVDLGAYERQ
jgi:hypothetical protein